MRSEVAEWEDLYRAILAMVSAVGRHDDRGEGDFLVPSDYLGNLSVDVLITRLDKFQPTVLRRLATDLQVLLGKRHYSWKVNLNIALVAERIDIQAFEITKKHVVELWDPQRVQSILKDKIRFEQ